MGRKRVLIAYKSLPAYRVRFFEDLRSSLHQDGVALDIVYGNPDRKYSLRGDTRALGCGTFLSNRILQLGDRRLIWQPILRRAMGYDLVILEQASSLLVNYPLLLLQGLSPFPRVALWGHGANLQSSAPNGLMERFKRRYSRLPHWWFAYTHGSARRVAELGYEPSRVTVVQNAIDTRGLRAQIEAVPPSVLAEFRLATDSAEGETALFIGSLYPEKRLDFLIEAAALVHRDRPHFRLLIVGDGPDRRFVERTSEQTSFIKFLGRLDGQARAVALRAADCILMPGLVGLGILDSFAASAPMLTTDHGFHSPEIEYMTPGTNGLLLDGWSSTKQYAEAIHGLLQDHALRRHLSEGCRTASEQYTNEAMVQNFRRGVHGALNSIS